VAWRYSGGNIPYNGPTHPSRSPVKGQGYFFADQLKRAGAEVYDVVGEKIVKRNL